MTRDDFVPRLERYLDEYEGTTPLPESVRMAVRAELPRMKQVRSPGGPASYMSMVSTRTAEIALTLAAAALVVAVGSFLSSGRNVGDGGPSPTPEPAASTVPTASASAATCEGTTVESRADGLAITWCSRGIGEPGAIAFTMDGDPAWVDQYFSGFGSLWLRPQGGGAITFALAEDQTVEQVVADISTREGYVAANEASVNLGGAPGTVVDLALAEGAMTDDVAPLIEDPDQNFRLQEGTFTRVWVVDVARSTIMIAVGEALADDVAEALRTIKWSS
jgi:hypothetical protein